MPTTKTTTTKATAKAKATTRRAARTSPRATTSRRAKATTDAPVANTGVPSPYALAELIVGRAIDWSAVGNVPALLEEVFQTPYADLFDPAAGSPLYLGQHVAADGRVTRARPELPTTGDGPVDADLSGARTLAELVERLGGADLADIPVRAAMAGRNGTTVALGETAVARDHRFSRIYDQRLIDVLWPELFGYHPDGFTWQDAGRFYNEGTEFLDPVQGAVGDCYFIAAMSSVAWSMPFQIVDRNRATALDDQAFTHRLGFYGAGPEETVEVTDRILLTNWGGTQFCRSKEGGEIWPAVYEKAYAKWRLGEPSDFPAIPNIAGGDASIACRALTGLADYRNWHNSYTADQILQLVKGHTVDGRTTTPMIAWTYGSGDAADVAYRDATVVANHAYSVLGWMQRREFSVDRFGGLDHLDVPVLIPDGLPGPIPGPDPAPFAVSPSGANGSPLVTGTVAEMARWMGDGFGRIPLRSRLVDYVVLRNPWGSTSATGSSVASGDHRARDLTWWRDIPLGVDGVFAMEINAYHRYFAGTGGAH